MTNRKKHDNLIVWGSISFLLVFTVATIFIAVKAMKNPENHDEETDALTADPTRPIPSRFSVTRVVDGDTVKVVGSDNIELDIRLAEIDAPELDQPYGKISQATLEELISGKEVELRDIRKGKYGRFVANIYCNGIWINIALVKSGVAWRYKESGFNDIMKAETNARRDKVGLWGEPDPIAPWEWREQKR
jgi:endonuclease YncB( thermonuclease family)